MRNHRRAESVFKTDFWHLTIFFTPFSRIRWYQFIIYHLQVLKQQYIIFFNLCDETNSFTLVRWLTFCLSTLMKFSFEKSIWFIRFSGLISFVETFILFNMGTYLIKNVDFFDNNSQWIPGRLNLTLGKKGQKRAASIDFR